MRSLLLPTVMLILLAGCEREELPVAPHESGTAITNAISMDANYRWQVYFDLSTNREVGRSPKTIWDLAFETTASGFHIFLNSSKAMSVWNTGDTTFTSFTDTSGFTAAKRYDAPSGHSDSTAIGNWLQDLPVYIIDRGYSETGQPQGIRKLQIIAVSPSAYEIRFSTLTGNENRLTIPKDSSYNFTFVSLATTGNLVNIEPPKNTWDIVFTQYTHIFHQPFTPYLVTGCLLNHSNTFASSDTLNTFENIDFLQAQQYVLSSSINTIGYEWKEFNGTEYVIVPNLFYIIRDRDGVYYKLRFIDFYDANGVKGNPKWEFQRL